MVYDFHMKLYLVRHGIAIDPEDPVCPSEAERYLTEKGTQRARKAAQGMRAMGVTADVIISSPLVRAIQTAEIFAEELEFKGKKLKKSIALEWGAPPENIFAELAKLKSPPDSIMLFGHAPHLDRTIALAIGANEDTTALKKSGAACLEMESLSPPHGQLVWLMTPKALRAMAD